MNVDENMANKFAAYRNTAIRLEDLASHSRSYYAAHCYLLKQYRLEPNAFLPLSYASGQLIKARSQHLVKGPPQRGREARNRANTNTIHVQATDRFLKQTVEAHTKHDSLGREGEAEEHTQMIQVSI